MEFTDSLFLVFVLIFFAGYVILKLIGLSQIQITRWIAFSSAFFYAVWYPPALLLILLHALLVRYGGLWLLWSKRPRLPLVVLVSLSLSILIFFKYFNFFASLFFPGQRILDVVLPVGISFYTFTAVGFYVDVYLRETLPSASISEAIVLVAFWPHLASGPILRAENVFENTQRPEPLTRSNLLLALMLISFGLTKKLLIADNVGSYVNWNVDYGIKGMNMVQAWSVLLGFGVQIYADFSGYSDMAIGFALLMGFRLPANFNHPYLATSFTDFWHRWHISLSRWFRDYVYFSLGVNRAGKVRALLNLFLVFVLSGLWHGAAINFVVWGALHGIALVIEKSILRYYIRVPAIFRWLITVVGVVVFWAYFRLPWEDATQLVSKLFITEPSGFESTPPYIHLPIFIFVGLIAVEHAVRFYRVDDHGFPVPNFSWLAVLVVAVFLPLSIIFFGKELPFIYFQF